MPRRLRLEEYLQGILRGDRVVLSRAITLVESRLAADQQLARALVEACLPHTGPGYRIGITGVPGVGKSTFIEALGMTLTAMGHRVAVLAVDPSSSLSKGSILGDKTRMERLAASPDAYIRPSPSGGSLGGIARRTQEAMVLCEAAGFDTLLIETVGVGQSETAVRDLTDAFLLLMLPGAGDELQGIKKGIMEMADLVAINKSDGAFLPKARAAKTMYSQSLRLFAPASSGWRPPVLLCSAVEGTGIGEIWTQLEQFRKLQMEGGHWQTLRARQAVHWMERSLHELLEQDFMQHPAVAARRETLQKAVAERQRSPLSAAEELLHLWRGENGGNTP